MNREYDLVTKAQAIVDFMPGWEFEEEPEQRDLRATFYTSPLKSGKPSFLNYLWEQRILLPKIEAQISREGLSPDYVKNIYDIIEEKELYRCPPGEIEINKTVLYPEKDCIVPVAEFLIVRAITDLVPLQKILEDNYESI